MGPFVTVAYVETNPVAAVQGNAVQPLVLMPEICTRLIGASELVTLPLESHTFRNVLTAIYSGCTFTASSGYCTSEVVARLPPRNSMNEFTAVALSSPT